MLGMRGISLKGVRVSGRVQDVKTVCRLSLCVAAAAMLVGCGGGANYNVHYNSMGLAPGSYIPLAQGEVPRLVESIDFPAGVERHLKAGYVTIGRMKFSGTHQRWNEVIDFAKEKGASLVLYGALRDGELECTYTVPVNSYSTTTHSGSIYDTGLNGSSYRYYGESSTTTTSYEERRYYINNYQHYFLFMAKKA